MSSYRGDRLYVAAVERLGKLGRVVAVRPTVIEARRAAASSDVDTLVLVGPAVLVGQIVSLSGAISARRLR